tara:strand:+ start:232 stop:483 length:252 start_codon:yes stop_codon:yes gene_type:complete
MNEKILRRYVRNILKEYYLMEKFKLKMPKMPKFQSIAKLAKSYKKQKLRNQRKSKDDISDISDQTEDLKKEEEIKKELGENYS